MTAASEPPAIITSARPRRIQPAASPMACALEEHALVVQKFGPLRRWTIETWPAAMFAMAAGMKYGVSRFGPLVRMVSWQLSMVLQAAEADADDRAGASRAPRRSARAGRPRRRSCVAASDICAKRSSSRALRLSAR